MPYAPGLSDAPPTEGNPPQNGGFAPGLSDTPPGNPKATPTAGYAPGLSDKAPDYSPDTYKNFVPPQNEWRIPKLVDRLEPIIAREAKKNGIPVDVLRAHVLIESSGAPTRRRELVASCRSRLRRPSSSAYPT